MKLLKENDKIKTKANEKKKLINLRKKEKKKGIETKNHKVYDHLVIPNCSFCCI